MTTLKCWGIPFGLTSNKEQTEEVTIEMKRISIKEFKEECKREGHKLTDKVYSFTK
jgi:uncharacterized membrane protein